MDILQTVLVTLLTLGALVTIHEFGHFWVARRCGVRVLRFSIGFGQPLWRRRGRGGTEYVIAAIPLGGYVKMLDEREGEVPPELLGEAFNRKPVQQRLAIVAAGPLANFLLAIAVYWALFLGGVTGVVPLISKVEPQSLAEMAGLEAGQEIVAVDGHPTPTREALHRRLMQRIGESGPLLLSVRYAGSDIVYDSSVELERWLAGEEAPDVVRGLGVELWYPPVAAVVAEVVADSPAALAGLQPGDRIVAADDQPIESWDQWVDYVRARPGQRIELRLLRNGVEQRLALVPARMLDDAGNAYGQVGVAVQPPQWPEEMLREFRYSPLGALLEAGRRTGEMSLFFLQSVKKMVLGEMSPKNLSGPVTIAKVASASASAGWEAYVGVLALLSISLGVLNLLPIPVLDGGHILYGLVEWVRGRPLSERVQLLGYQIGLFVIVGVMLLALYNDLMRL
jgi:regulator of sigma E protease